MNEALTGQSYLSSLVVRIVKVFGQSLSLEGFPAVQVLRAIDYFEDACGTNGLTMTDGRPMVSEALGCVQDSLAVLYGDIDVRWLYVNSTGHSYGITAQTQHTALPL